MKKVHFLLMLAIAILALDLSAQAPAWSWAVNNGGTASDENKAITTDNSGNIFVTGNYYSSSITFGSTTLSNAGQNDAFLTKYDDNGNILWAVKTGGTGYDFGKAVATDSAGNVYVMGNFQSPSISFGATTLNTAGAEDIFVAKFNSSGILQYEFRLGGTGSDMAYGIVTDGTSAFYITGSYNGTVSFGASSITSIGGNDVFIAKYSLNGVLQWVKSAGSTSADNPAGICLDPSNNPIIAGHFYGSAIMFGTAVVNNIAASNYQIFAAKYDPSGNIQWAKGCGGSASDIPYSVTSDLNGNVYVSGYMSSPAMLFGTTSLSTNGGVDIFLAKYSSAGVELWAKNLGGSGTETAYGVSTDENNSVYITGDIGSAGINFGSTILNTTGTGRDFYIAKYTELGVEEWATSSGGTGQDYGFGMDIDIGGNIVVCGSSISPSISFGATTLYQSTYDGFVAKISALVRPDICMVTVDSLSEYNMIYWDKTTYLGVDSFIVYRETTINNYKRIGAVHSDSLSMIVDTVRFQYFPNTGNPNQGTYKYKLQIRSLTGDLSDMSPWHKTIFVNQTGGVFTFNDYSVEGQPVPVPQLVQYLLIRDDNSTGLWNVLSANTSSPMNDPAYAAYPNASWRVETDWTINCEPTRATVNTTRSNIKHNAMSIGMTDLNDNTIFEIYPNPAAEKVNIRIGNLNETSVLSLTNILGDVVYSKVIQSGTNTYSQELNLEGFSKGLYILSLNSDNRIQKKKLTVK